MKNVLEYLEYTAGKYPQKTAVIDTDRECTFLELLTNSRAVGYHISRFTDIERPVAVFMEKGVAALEIFLGIVNAGCFYTLVDPGFPASRVEKILSVLEPEIIVTDAENYPKLKEIWDRKVIIYSEDLLKKISREYSDENGEDALRTIREAVTDKSPLYCNFTSGSTGVPKGVLVGHSSVIDFIDVFTGTFDILEDEVIGNQAPFDFDVSVKDIYSCLKTGATLVIIPKKYFSFPNNVVEMLEKHKVTTLIWAVSALTLLNRLHALKHIRPSALKKIMFSGEMMPVKQLNQWREYYPEAMFVNLYGPTEITCNCTYYVIERHFEEGEKIPMGKSFPNEKVFLLDESDRLIKASEVLAQGEICVAGTALALGYYNNEENTRKAFVQNPVNDKYPELIYRTGDIGYYGDDGNMYFAGRKDFQIKHMGHRIELEEVEAALGSVPYVEHACCFFDEEKGKLVAYYVGDGDKKKIIDWMRVKVPEYMIPNVFRCVESLPLNKNGKTDRKQIFEMYKKGR